jgi:hypothetical protein
VHKALELEGLLHHSVGQLDEDALVPVLQWDGNSFKPIRPEE